MLRGVWAAALTPVTAGLQPEPVRAIEYYRALMDDGCDGIVAHGTTGEAMSFGIGARIRFLTALAAELPRDRLIAGTGAAALEDTIALTRQAAELGYAAALVMPPFFFRTADEDGIFNYFARVLDAAPSIPILLYHFPAVSGVAITPSLVDRIVFRFPSRVAGVKDSANDAALRAQIHARHPGLALFPGSEAGLGEALRDGAAGCISGSVALWPSLAQRAYRDRRDDAFARLTAARALLDGCAMIPCVRDRVARSTGETEWSRAMPPLEALGERPAATLDARFAAFGAP